MTEHYPQSAGGSSSPGAPPRSLRLVSKLRSNYERSGPILSRILGQGLQFAELRPYTFGDDVKRIDWRSTARSGQVQVKTYTEERTLPVVLALDASASTFAGASPSQPQSCAFSQLIIQLVQREHHALGLLPFAEGAEELLPPRRGAQVSEQIRHRVLNLQARAGKTSVGGALSTLAERLRHQSLIFVVSDFLCPPFETELRHLALRHDVILVSSGCPTCPTPTRSLGFVRVRDAEQNQVRLLRAPQLEGAQSNEADLQALAARCHADFISIRSSVAAELSALMARRLRRGAR